MHSNGYQTFILSFLSIIISLVSSVEIQSGLISLNCH